MTVFSLFSGRDRVRTCVTPTQVIVLAVLTSVLSAPAFGQRLLVGDVNDEFPVFEIEQLDSLSSPGIVRYHGVEFEQKGPASATMRVHKVTTVFSKEGDGMADIQVYYDGLRKLKKFGGRVRNAFGKVVYKMGKDDQNDYSAISSYSLYENSRVRVAGLRGSAYPFTVEYWYELEYNGISHWPTFFPQESEAPVERAVFRIKAPPGIPIRHQAQGTTVVPTMSVDPSNVTYVWDFADIGEFRREPWGPSVGTQLMAIHTATSVFEVGGVPGDMSSWRSFGAWFGKLSQGRDRLPKETVAELISLVEGAPNDLEKARRLYRRLQEKTRYVSVQLGLGGWQPYDAIYVDQRGYGDCKALTNYMLSMLKAVGIEAYPALIRNGVAAPPVLDDFPCNQFNHVILYLPGSDGQETWLECTSQTIPFGRISASNEDRPALVIRPDGGELIWTPNSAATDNMQNRSAEIVFDGKGDADVRVVANYTGNQQDRIRGSLVNASPKDQSNWLHEELALGTGALASFEFSGLDNNLDSLKVAAEFESTRLVRRTGKRMFIRPNFLGSLSTVPPELEVRTQPVVFPYAYADVDSFVYRPLAGYKVEVVPPPVTIEFPFASYSSSTEEQNDGTLIYRRRLEVRSKSIPAESYEEVRSFFQQVTRAERDQIVLVYTR